MTKQETNSSPDSHPVEPVSDAENIKVHGKALCDERLFLDHIKEVKGLREQQGAYLASLPTEPKDAIKAALRILHPSGENYPSGMEDAMQLSTAIVAMLRDDGIGGDGWMREAANHIAFQVEVYLHGLAEQIDRVSDILSNPGRHERDAMIAGEPEARVALIADVLKMSPPESLLADDGAPSAELLAFCRQSGASLDFIFCGDLRAMIRRSHVAEAQPKNEAPSAAPSQAGAMPSASVELLSDALKLAQLASALHATIRDKSDFTKALAEEVANRADALYAAMDRPASEAVGTTKAHAA